MIITYEGMSDAEKQRVERQLEASKFLTLYDNDAHLHVRLDAKKGSIAAEGAPGVGFYLAEQGESELELFSRYVQKDVMPRLPLDAKIQYRTLDMRVAECVDAKLLVELALVDHGLRPVEAIADLYEVHDASYGWHMKRFFDATCINIAKLTQNLCYIGQQRGLSPTQREYLDATDELRWRTSQIFHFLVSTRDQSPPDAYRKRGMCVHDLYNALFLSTYTEEVKDFLKRVIPKSNGNITEFRHRVWLDTHRNQDL